MKLLPVPEPLIRYSPSVDHFSSILNLYSDRTIPWIIENYIEVVFNPTEGESCFMAEFLDNYKVWWNCPFINVSRMERALLIDQDILSIVKRAIDRNAYVMMVIDTYYISGYKTYQQHHRSHEIFLYGYDENSFYAIDYFDFNHCTNKTISFCQLLDAYMKFSDKEYDYLCGVVFFRADLEVINNGRPDIQFQYYKGRSVYIPDRTLIKQRLEGFLEGSPLVLASFSNYFDPCFGFITGYSAFERIGNEISVESIEYLKKPFSLLYAHIQIMTLRVCYLNERYELHLESLCFRCKELETRCKLMRNKYLKDLFLKKNNVNQLANSYEELLIEYKKVVELLIRVL